MKRHITFVFILVILFVGIFTPLVQLLSLTYLSSQCYGLLASTAVLLLCCHILLQISDELASIFLYLLIEVLATTCILCFNLTFDKLPLISTTYSLEPLLLLNLLIPCLYAWLKNLFSEEYLQQSYHTFFRNSSIVFFLFYVPIFFLLEYGFLLTKTSLPVDQFLEQFPFFQDMITGFPSSGSNYIPFYTAAGYIEDYIYQLRDFPGIFSHLILPVFLYLPLGYYLSLGLRSFHRLVKLFLFVAIPLLVEMLQVLFEVAFFNIDDILYGSIGLLLGSLVYWIMNQIYHYFQGRDFLRTERHYNHSLHF